MSADSQEDSSLTSDDDVAPVLASCEAGVAPDFPALTPSLPHSQQCVQSSWGSACVFFAFALTKRPRPPPPSSGPSLSPCSRTRTHRTFPCI